jgi:hypothetical protein
MAEDLPAAEFEDHDDFVSALEVIAEVSEVVIKDLKREVIAEASRETFFKSPRQHRAESERHFNYEMSKVVGGVALCTIGAAFETAALPKPADHKILMLSGMIALSAGAFSLLKGRGQVSGAIAQARTQRESEKELIN